MRRGELNSGRVFGHTEFGGRTIFCCSSFLVECILPCRCGPWLSISFFPGGHLNAIPPRPSRQLFDAAKASPSSALTSTQGGNFISCFSLAASSPLSIGIWHLRQTLARARRYARAGGSVIQKRMTDIPSQPLSPWLGAPPISLRLHTVLHTGQPPPLSFQRLDV